MYNKFMNNVRFCLGMCAVVALIGLIIGFVLYFKDDTAYAFIVTVGSGLLLFLVVIIATVISRCLTSRSSLLHLQQRFSGDYPRVGKVFHDPPPPYKRSWAKEFENSHDTPEPRSGSLIFDRSFDLIRHLEGSTNTRTSLDKLTQLEIQRQGVSVNTVGSVLESPPNDELPSYNVAIRQLSARDLQNAYNEQLSVQTEGRMMPTGYPRFENEITSTSLQVSTGINLDSYHPQHNVVTERDLAPVHFPGKTLISIIACFENTPHLEDDNVVINIEG